MLHRLGHVPGRQRDGAVVAPAAAPRGLEVVLLTTGHVEDHRRELVESQLGDALLHEGEALPARAGGRSGAGRRRPDGHVHRLYLAGGVHADPARTGELAAHVLEQLGERRHRIAAEEPATGGQGRLGDRFAALHEAPGHDRTATSGHAGAAERRHRRRSGLDRPLVGGDVLFPVGGHQLAHGSDDRLDAHHAGDGREGAEHEKRGAHRTTEGGRHIAGRDGKHLRPRDLHLEAEQATSSRRPPPLRPDSDGRSPRRPGPSRRPTMPR